MNIDRQFGRARMNSWAFIIVILSFIGAFLMTEWVLNPDLSDSMLVLVVFILFVQPSSIAFEVLPFLFSKKKARIGIRYVSHLPYLAIHYPTQVKKYIMLLSLFFPFVGVTVSCILLLFFFPQYAHFICMAFALNNGLCFKHFLYITILAKAPKRAVIERRSGQYEILVQQMTDTRHSL